MKYRTIVADPPWDYGKDNERSVSFTHGGKGPRIERSMGYVTMTAEQIAALPLADLAAKESRLFLWATNRHLPLALELLDRWGFAYRQTLVWRKTGNPSPFGGSVAPNHAEFLLVGVRGAPEGGRLASSVIEAPAVVQGHSRKPECFIDHIEQVSPGPYLEMFARRARFGWDYWGDQSLGNAELTGLASEDRCDGCEVRPAVVYSPPHAASFCEDCARLARVAFDEGER